MALSELYQNQILEHNRSPHNRFEPDAASHAARGRDALCGDDIRIWLCIRDGIVETAGWSGNACAITTASASMLTDWLTGRAVGQIRPAFKRFTRLLDDPQTPDDPDLGEINVLRAVGAFPSRRRNALLPWETVLDALSQPSAPSSS